MKIRKLETLLANAGQRNYLFVRLTTDSGLTGIGEATLEWQEQAVEVLVNEWVASRIIGKDPFDIEAVVGGMIRDQYQGGSTVMTAISSVEIAMWDLIGKATGQPVQPHRRPRHAGPRRLCQRLVRRLRDAGRFCRARPAGRVARLSRAAIRPVPHCLEAARPGRGGPCRRRGRGGGRCGRARRRPDDRDPRAARGERRRPLHRPARGPSHRLVRGAGGAGERRTAPRGQGADAPADLLR